MDDHDIAKAAGYLRKARKVSVLTGAGVSKESGVPTFRDAQDGLWFKYNPEELATPAAFRANPKLVWDWYAHRRRLVETVRPNPGHYGLAELEDLLPHLTIITQNIDGLHQMAGSSDVIELHGNARRYKCFNDCQGDPTFIDLGEHWDVPDGPPLCPHCGSEVRPDVVWFTERLPIGALERATSISNETDLMLVIGTSGVVRPASSLPYYAKRNEAVIIDINPVQDEIAAYADLFLGGPSGEILPKIVHALRQPTVDAS